MTSIGSPQALSFPQSILVGTWPKFQPSPSSSATKIALKCATKIAQKIACLNGPYDRRNVEADEKIKQVDIEERQSSLLSPSPSLFPTIIFDIVCYFCGIFITKPGGCSRFSGRPSVLCSAVQTASVRVDTPRYNYMELPPTENGSCLCKYFHG